MVKLKATKHEARKKAARLEELAKPSGLAKALSTGAGELRKKRVERTSQQLLSRLTAERNAAAPLKKRSKRGSSTLLGAVASMKDSLDELLASSETKTVRAAPPQNPSSTKGRLKLLAVETKWLRDARACETSMRLDGQASSHT